MFHSFRKFHPNPFITLSNLAKEQTERRTDLKHNLLPPSDVLNTRNCLRISLRYDHIIIGYYHSNKEQSARQELISSLISSFSRKLKYWHACVMTKLILKTKTSDFEKKRAKQRIRSIQLIA